MFPQALLSNDFLTGMVENWIQLELLGPEIFGPSKPWPTTLVGLDERDNSRVIIPNNLPGGKSNLLPRDGFTNKTFKMARNFDHILITMAELYNQRLIGTQGELITSPANLQKYVKSELKYIMEKYQRTKEKIRWDTLRTGVATYTYPAGGTVTIDYGLDSTNQIKDAQATWATAGTDIPSDIQVVKRWFKKRYGKVKITAYHGDNVSRYLQNNTVIKHGEATKIREQINATGEITHFLGIKWVEYLTEYIALDGSTVTPYIPDDYIIFIADVPGSFDELSGPPEATTLAAVIPGFKVDSMGNGIVSYMDIIKDPAAMKVFVEEYFISRILRKHSIFVMNTTP